MLRVLQVLPALTHCGGIEAYLLNYYRHLDYQRVNFDFITHGEVLPEIRQEIESCGGRVFQADPISLATLRSLDRWIWQFLQQHAREYTAIHCHMANAGFLYFPLAQAAGIRVCILYSHNNRAAAVWSHAVRNMPLIRMGDACATHRVACSAEAGRFLFGSLPFEQIRNAMDVNSFMPNADRRAQMRCQLGMEQACIVGHVGRLDPQKNQMFLLRVFDGLYVENEPQQFANTIAWLLGHDDERLCAGIRARKFVELHHSNEATLPILQSLYQEVAQEWQEECVCVAKVTEGESKS